jgi:hypothetical protein
MPFLLIGSAVPTILGGWTAVTTRKVMRLVVGLVFSACLFWFAGKCGGYF